MGNRLRRYLYTFAAKMHITKAYIINVLKNGKYEKKNYLLALYDLSGGNGMV